MGLVYFALFVPLIPAILAIVKWSKLNLSQRIFGGMLWFIIVVSFSGHIWSLMTSSNNLPFYYIYILGEYLFLIQIFKRLFKIDIKDQVWITLNLAFIIAWGFDVVVGEGWLAFPNYIRALEACTILILVIIWFIKLLSKKEILKPYQTFEFWLCSGLLIYFSGNFLLFLFSELILNAGNEVFHAIWKVNAILNILLYTMYFIGLLWVRRTVK